MKYKNTSELSKKIHFQKILANPFIVIVSNWLFQGMRYMETGERYLKIACTLIPSLVIVIIIIKAKGGILLSEIVLSFIFCHTLNWIFNGHIFVLMRYLPIKSKMTIDKMKSFINDIYKRSCGVDFLQAILIFGSLSRGEIGSTSDLDVRIMRQKGAGKTFKAYLFTIRLRFLAFIKRFPLDVYTFGDISYLQRLRKDEPPVIVIDNGFVEKYYNNYSYYQDILNELKFRNEKGN